MLSNIHWGSLIAGILIAWFGMPLLTSLLAKAKGSA